MLQAGHYQFSQAALGTFQAKEYLLSQEAREQMCQQNAQHLTKDIAIPALTPRKKL